MWCGHTVNNSVMNPLQSESCCKINCEQEVHRVKLWINKRSERETRCASTTTGVKFTCEPQQDAKTRTDMGKIFQVVVNGLRDKNVVVDLCNTEEQMKSMTVLQLKEKVVSLLPDSSASFRLAFADKQLDEDVKSLSEYGIQHMSVILIILRVPGGKSKRPRARDVAK